MTVVTIPHFLDLNIFFRVSVQVCWLIWISHSQLVVIIGHHHSELDVAGSVLLVSRDLISIVYLVKVII